MRTAESAKTELVWKRTPIHTGMQNTIKWAFPTSGEDLIDCTVRRLGKKTLVSFLPTPKINSRWSKDLSIDK